MFKTGWFGIPMKLGSTYSRSTKVHVVNSTGVPICRYRPIKTMEFQECAKYIQFDYIECENCKTKAKTIFSVEEFQENDKSQTRYFCRFSNRIFNLNLSDIIKKHSASFKTKEEAIKHGIYCQRLYFNFLKKINESIKSI